MKARLGALRRRTVVIASTAAVAATTLSATPATAQVTKPSPPSPQGGRNSVTLDGVPPGSYTITLITGDRVKLTGSGGRSFNLDVEPADRPDGGRPVLRTDGVSDDVFVIPQDAEKAIASGQLDRSLFNVKYLAENGYTDDQRGQLPVIVQYPASRGAAAVKGAAEALAASTPTRALESIHGAALDVPKAQAGSFWTSVRSAGAVPGKTAAPAAGIAKIWLDRKVKATLEQSVPLVGAPQAWAAGHDGKGVKVAVLDTGIDPTHPDLEDKIESSKSFVPGQEVKDGRGHGTHVASTIVGSGSASGGKRKGVAPGARLIVGKVLNDNSEGQWSWAIDGLEWAAASGARVVNMSFGGDPTDGTDPISQTVNRLTADTGTLFVIAAGNSGRDQSVGTPGAADAALTVAATEKNDKLAYFSSRGPRLGDLSLKPDIAGPGQHIGAARAAGTALCENQNECVQPEDGPIDEHYTAASGTSMAAPHVAGAAAVLAQQHPDWTAGRLKAALMSTSKDAGHTVYQQGAGRLDLARADRQKVFATTANLDYAIVSDRQSPAARQLSYANLTETPVTLTLTATLKTAKGEPAPGSALTVDRSVTVPAGGTVSAGVRLDAGRLDHGTYTGEVNATDAATGTQLRTPVGLVREPLKHTLTVRTLDRDGKPVDADRLFVVDVVGTGGLATNVRRISQGVHQVRVPAGTYSISQAMSWVDTSYRENTGYLFEPEITVSDDADITLDARRMQQITFATQRPVEVIPFMPLRFGFERITKNGDVLWSRTPVEADTRLWATPTKRVAHGRFLLQTALPLGHPEVMLTIPGPRPVRLHPLLFRHLDAETPGFVPFTGKRTLELIDAGAGRKEDLTGRDLRGKLALMDNDQDCSTVRMDRIHNVRDAGAAGILVWPARERYSCASGPTIPLRARPTIEANTGAAGIAFASLPPPEARELRDQLARGPVTIQVTGTPRAQNPYTYQFSPIEDGRVPASLHYDLTDRRVAQIDLDIHAAQRTTVKQVFSSEKLTLKTDPYRTELPPVSAPSRQRHYIGPLSAEVIHRRGVNPSGGVWWQSADVFDRPTRSHERWNVPPATPGAITASKTVYAIPDPDAPVQSERMLARCSICRQGDVLYPHFQGVAGERRFGGEVVGAGIVYHLYKNGTEVPLESTIPGWPSIRGFRLTKEPADYRLTVDHTIGPAATTATWTFRSQTVTQGTSKPGYWCYETIYPVNPTTPCRPEPVIFVNYDLGSSVALNNTVAAPGIHRFQVKAYHSPSRVAMPKIAGLKLWYSTDDGRHWQRAVVLPRGTGSDVTYDAFAIYPPANRTTGMVSLKVEAWDDAGNRLEQTTKNAFNLRSDDHNTGANK